jgi:hypothetical protein
MTWREIEEDVREQVDDYTEMYNSKICWLCNPLSQSVIPADRFMSTEDSRPDIDD